MWLRRLDRNIPGWTRWSGSLSVSDIIAPPEQPRLPKNASKCDVNNSLQLLLTWTQPTPTRFSPPWHPSAQPILCAYRHHSSGGSCISRQNLHHIETLLLSTHVSDQGWTTILIERLRSEQGLSISSTGAIKSLVDLGLLLSRYFLLCLPYGEWRNLVRLRFAIKLPCRNYSHRTHIAFVTRPWGGINDSPTTASESTKTMIWRSFFQRTRHETEELCEGYL